MFFYALLTAIATGLGALPLIFAKYVSKKYLALGNAFAAGLMISASFSLIYEGTDYSTWKTISGMIAGLVLISLSNNFLSKRNLPDITGLSGAKQMKAFLIIGIMTLHSFAEGVGVGVSFGDSESFGKFISLAIAIHNIPEGLAISLVLVPKGVSVFRSFNLSVVSSLPQPLMAVPAFLFVVAFKAFLPIGLGLAAGAMIWIVFSELIPDAIKDSEPGLVAIVVTVSISVMTFLQVIL